MTQNSHIPVAAATIVCNMSAFSPEEQQRYRALRAKVMEALVVRPADDQLHWLDLEGGAGVKELLRAEFDALRAPNALAR